MSDDRGQATVALLLLAVLAAAGVLVVGGLVRSAVERAHAQRVADVAALTGARVLARGGAPAAALAAARLAGLAAGARDVRVEARADGVELRVVLRAHRVGLPRLLGGGAVHEAGTAVARAVPGAPRATTGGVALAPARLGARLAAVAAAARVPAGLLAASISAAAPPRAPSPERAASAFAALAPPAADPWAAYVGAAGAERLARAAGRLASALRRAGSEASALALLDDPAVAGRPPPTWPPDVAAYVRRTLSLEAGADPAPPVASAAAAHLVP